MVQSVARHRLLVVEDDQTIGSTLVRALGSQGYEASWTSSGNEAIELASRSDLVLLDLGLPDLDGIAVCHAIKRADELLPVIMLTARQSEIDVVLGLDAGAVDYVRKPFSLVELLARIRVQLRTVTASASMLEVGDLRVDPAARRVWVAGDEVVLRAKELDLLVVLAGSAGRVVTRERLMAAVWDEHWFGSTKTLDVTMASLRRKLGERAGAPSRITALRGVGYRVEAP
jgi:DNA-binding response OmpR family regulator